MHHHGELLGGNDEERLRRKRAARDHAATLEMEDRGGAGALLRKTTGAHACYLQLKSRSSGDAAAL